MDLQKRGLMLLDHHKTCYVLLLLFFAMAMLDGLMTTFALQEGRYYETNPLTQRVGPFVHYVALIVTVSAMYITILMILPVQALTIILTALNLVWFFNNAYSIILLLAF